VALNQYTHTCLPHPLSHSLHSSLIPSLPPPTPPPSASPPLTPSHPPSLTPLLSPSSDNGPHCSETSKSWPEVNCGGIHAGRSSGGQGVTKGVGLRGCKVGPPHSMSRGDVTESTTCLRVFGVACVLEFFRVHASTRFYGVACVCISYACLHTVLFVAFVVSLRVCIPPTLLQASNWEGGIRTPGRDADCMLYRCPLHALQMLTACSTDAHCTLYRCSLHAVQMLTACITDAHCMYYECQVFNSPLVSGPSHHPPLCYCTMLLYYCATLLLYCYYTTTILRYYYATILHRIHDLASPDQEKRRDVGPRCDS
jgi:hypothetical protein